MVPEKSDSVGERQDVVALRRVMDVPVSGQRCQHNQGSLSKEMVRQVCHTMQVYYIPPSE